MVNLPAGKSLIASGEMMSAADFMREFGRVHGVETRHEQIPVPEWTPEIVAFGREAAEAVQYFDEFGYTGNGPSVFHPKDVYFPFLLDFLCWLTPLSSQLGVDVPVTKISA